MSTETAFYLTCAVVMAVGFILCLIGWLVEKASERVGGWVIALGVLCALTGPFMAAIGPR